MRFVVLIRDDESGSAGAPPESLFAAMDDFRADTSLARVVDDGGLMPSESAIRFELDHGRVSELDGPYAESKEIVGGFLVVESASAESMAEWTRAFVDLHAAHWPALSVVVEAREIASDPGQ
jgi:hypothetical protein